MEAGFCVCWFEVGGFLGSLAAGWASDLIFKGKRNPINILFTLFALFVIVLQRITPFYMPILDAIYIFMLGFFIFGPQMLIGMAAAELSHKKAAGTATGFAGWFAYFGAGFSGFLATQGWYSFFLGLGICGIVSLILLTPLWSAKARQEKAA